MDYFSQLIGRLRIETSERGICGIRFLTKDEEPILTVKSEIEQGYVASCVSALNTYFAKQWGTFNQMRSKIPLDLKGTDFQKKVWSIIYSMPNTSPIVSINYSELALLANKPGAARACAKACAQNSIPILIPCHRIVTANGEMGGYIGGVDKKALLLWHEEITKSSKTNFYYSNPPQTR